MIDRFDLHVTYSQLAVFPADMDDPFNMWTDSNVLDGFSSGRGSVSFKTPFEDAIFGIEVTEIDKSDKSSDGTIEVPFDVPLDGRIEIASISDACLITMASGKFKLRYEILEDKKLRLGFIRE